MRHELQAQYPAESQKVKFYIGDVRDINSVDVAMTGVDYIFHAAALKQVPSCEFFPIEAVKTNVLGTENVLTSAINYIRNAEILIVGGTSLNVYPAAGLINYYRGNKLVLINLSETPYDSYADLVIHEKIGEVFSRI